MGLIGPVRSGGKWGFLTPSGVWAIEPRFDVLGPIREGLAGFVENGKIGFIDESGRINIPPLFECQNSTIWGFREGLAPVTPNCSQYIDRQGRIVLKLPPNGRGGHFIEGKAIFMDHQGTYSVIDTSGSPVASLPIFEAPFLPDWPESWDCFVCWCKTDSLRIAALNWKGEILFPPKYPSMSDFFDGVAVFSEQEDSFRRLFGLVEMSGQILRQPCFYEVGAFREGVAGAGLTPTAFGFINSRGEWLIEPRFIGVKPFSDGIACVTVNDNTRYGKKGFINRHDQFVIEPRFERATSFRDGFAEVEYEGKRAIISKEGGVVWESGIENE